MKAARSIGSLLNVIASVDDLGEDVHVSSRLILAAHDAERHHSPAVLRDHPGDDRVKRPLLRRDGVWMTALQIEARASVLQQDARIFCVDAAAKCKE